MNFWRVTRNSISECTSLKKIKQESTAYIQLTRSNNRENSRVSLRAFCCVILRPHYFQSKPLPFCLFVFVVRLKMSSHLWDTSPVLRQRYSKVIILQSAHWVIMSVEFLTTEHTAESFWLHQSELKTVIFGMVSKSIQHGFDWKVWKYHLYYGTHLPWLDVAFGQTTKIFDSTICRMQGDSMKNLRWNTISSFITAAHQSCLPSTLLSVHLDTRTPIDWLAQITTIFEINSYLMSWLVRPCFL